MLSAILIVAVALQVTSGGDSVDVDLGATEGASSSPVQEQPGDDNAKSQEAPTARPVAPALPPAEPPRSPESTQAQVDDGGGAGKDGDKSDKGANAVEWDWWFAAVLVVVGIIQATVGVWQWKVMHIANEQTQETIELMRLERRAWVSVAGPTIKELKAGELMEYAVNLRNTGPTPAYLDQSFGKMFTRPADQDISPEVEIVHGSNETSRRDQVIAPDSTLHSVGDSKPDKLAEDVLAEIKAGTRTLYLVGAVVYRDQTNTTRKTTYCFQYIPKDGTLSAHPKYNRME
jgi:hypothetical protein